MIDLLRNVAREKNSLGLLVAMCGFVLGSFSYLTVLAVGLVFLHASNILIAVLCGISVLLTLIGCLLLLAMEWVNPSEVKRMPSIFKLAVGASFLMPLIVGSLTILLVSFIPMLRVYCAFYKLLNATPYGHKVHEAITNVEA